MGKKGLNQLSMLASSRGVNVPSPFVTAIFNRMVLYALLALLLNLMLCAFLFPMDTIMLSCWDATMMNPNGNIAMDAPGDMARSNQTLERLSQVAIQLRDLKTFNQHVTELATWCLDERAYVPTYEPKLVNCLRVVYEMVVTHTFKVDITSGKTTCYMHTYTVVCGRIMYSRQDP